MVRVADRLESQGTLSAPSNTRHSVFILIDGIVILDDGGRGRRRVRSRTSLSPTLGPSSFPSPQSRASSWDTRILAASRHWWRVGPLNCVRWRSLEGVTVTLVTHRLQTASRCLPPCVRSRARGRPHGPLHTTGFTVLFRMGPSGKWRRGRVVGAVTESLRARLLVTGNAHVPIPGRARALGQVLPKRQRDASLDVVCQGKGNMTQCERQRVTPCACSMHAPTCVQRPFPGWCRRTYDDTVPHRTERTLRATCHVVPRSERDVSPRAGRGRPRTACELRHGPVEVRVAKDTAAEMRVGGTV